MYCSGWYSDLHLYTIVELPDECSLMMSPKTERKRTALYRERTVKTFSWKQVTLLPL